MGLKLETARAGVASTRGFLNWCLAAGPSKEPSQPWKAAGTTGAIANGCPCRVGASAVSASLPLGGLKAARAWGPNWSTWADPPRPPKPSITVSASARGITWAGGPAGSLKCCSFGIDSACWHSSGSISTIWCIDSPKVREGAASRSDGTASLKDASGCGSSSSTEITSASSTGEASCMATSGSPLGTDGTDGTGGTGGPRAGQSCLAASQHRLLGSCTNRKLLPSTPCGRFLWKSRSPGSKATIPGLPIAISDMDRYRSIWWIKAIWCSRYTVVYCTLNPAVTKKWFPCTMLVRSRPVSVLR